MNILIQTQIWNLNPEKIINSNQNIGLGITIINQFKNNLINTARFKEKVCTKNIKPNPTEKNLTKNF